MNSSVTLLGVWTPIAAALPSILGAILILVIGWLIAVLVRAGLRRLLSAASVNRTIETSTGHGINIESPIAIGAFWLILLITLVAMLNALNLTGAATPFTALLQDLLGYLPNLLAGVGLVLVAWLIATVLRAVAVKLMGQSKIDERLSSEAGMAPMSKNVADVLFWLVILLFLPAVLSTLQIKGLLIPVQSMLSQALAVLPDVFGAIVIGGAGWIVAKILRSLVVSLLDAAGVDKIARRAGVDDSVSISRLCGMLVFIFVFVPSLIAALEALHLDAISQPASAMLGQFMTAVPNILAAALILALTYYVARFATGLVASLLNGLGFDTLPKKLGATRIFQDSAPPSRIVGGLLMYFAMLFATAEAANRLGFEKVRGLVGIFIEFSANILLGGVILLVGFWLANLAQSAINRTGGDQGVAAGSIARFAILGLVLAMGLRAMGIADDIVNLAFGLTLGSVAVAAALAFGLGGREAAGKHLDHWLTRLRGGE